MWQRPRQLELPVRRRQWGGVCSTVRCVLEWIGHGKLRYSLESVTSSGGCHTEEELARYLSITERDAVHVTIQVQRRLRHIEPVAPPSISNTPRGTALLKTCETSPDSNRSWPAAIGVCVVNTVRPRTVPKSHRRQHLGLQQFQWSKRRFTVYRRTVRRFRPTDMGYRLRHACDRRPRRRD